MSIVESIIQMKQIDIKFTKAGSINDREQVNCVHLTFKWSFYCVTFY